MPWKQPILPPGWAGGLQSRQPKQEAREESHWILKAENGRRRCREVHEWLAKWPE